jgi:outer membrane protein OmpA-like peptidoglycan-associated protein
MSKFISLILVLSIASFLCAQKAETHFFQKNSVLILFETDSYAVDSIDPSLIYRMQKFLFDFPECNIQLEGRTDFRGSQEYNLKLAEKRVTAVLDRSMKDR